MVQTVRFRWQDSLVGAEFDEICLAAGIRGDGWLRRKFSHSCQVSTPHHRAKRGLRGFASELEVNVGSLSARLTELTCTTKTGLLEEPRQLRSGNCCQRTYHQGHRMHYRWDRSTFL